MSARQGRGGSPAPRAGRRAAASRAGEAAARRVQKRARAWLARVVEVGAELAEAEASLPAIAAAQADAMTNAKRPRSLLFFVQGMVLALRAEEVALLCAALEQLVGKTAGDLEREWKANREKPS